MPRENKRRIRRSRKFAGAVTKKNGNGVITLVGHSEILVTIAVEVSRGNRSGVEAHANRDGFLKRAIAVAEEHVHGVRKRITGDQVMASAAGECRRSDSGKGRRRCAARSSQRNGRTGGLRKRALIAVLIQQNRNRVVDFVHDRQVKETVIQKICGHQSDRAGPGGIRSAGEGIARSAWIGRKGWTPQAAGK